MWTFNRKAILCLPLESLKSSWWIIRGKCWEHVIFLSVSNAGDVCAPRDWILPSAMYLTSHWIIQREKSFQWWKRSCRNTFKSQRLLDSHTVLTCFQWERRYPGRRPEDLAQVKTCLWLPLTFCPQVGTGWLRAEVKRGRDLWDAA